MDVDSSIKMSATFEDRGRELSKTGIAKIVMLYQQGMSSEQIAKKTGIAMWVVKLILRLEGL
jgi:hypothetical protein